MTTEHLEELQHKLLDDVLNKALTQNNEQIKQWTKYKKEHERISQVLEQLPNDLYANCMVPIGKRALMKGKLIHTNEILASIGGEYFAKYTAKGATMLCERRIKLAEGTLENLERERDLYEMRQIVPFESDAFKDEDTKDITEFWEEEKIDDWRRKHRDRQKEYHKKLAESRQKAVKKIETEEDLFERLDQLELEEELADELNRMDSGDNGMQYLQGTDEDCTDSSDDTEEEDVRQILEEELAKLEEIRSRRGAESQNQLSTENIILRPPENSSEQQQPDDELKIQSDANQEEKKKEEEITEETKIDEISVKVKKSISFGGCQEKIFHQDDHAIFKEPINTVDESEIIKINFKHAENTVEIVESTENEIRSPRDIYEVFKKPSSILKRREGDLIVGERVEMNFDEELNEEEEEEEDEGEEEAVKPSIYQSVVKDIKERTPKIEQPNEAQKETRPVSKFKRDRSSR